MYLNNVVLKVWRLLRVHVLTLQRFDLNLQGALLTAVLLSNYVTLLLRRGAGTGQIRAQVEDWIQIGSTAAELVLGTILAWVGRKQRPFALAGCFALTGIAGLLILFTPFEDADLPTVELCGGVSVSSWYSVESEPRSETVNAARSVLLVVTAVLCALARIGVWAHGLTYLDDHDPHNGPYFYGILISIQLSLGLNAESWLQSTAVSNNWWVPLTALSSLTLFFALAFSLFPTKMPNFIELEETEEGGFAKALCKLVRNKAVVLQTLALSLLSTALYGFVYFDNAYVQARFHVETLRQDPRTSRVVSDIFRSLVVIFFVMIFRVRFSVRRSDGVKSTTAAKVGAGTAVFGVACFVVLASLSCGASEVLGIGSDLPDCSSDCGCDSGRYGFSPVCAVDTGVTYFSPCTAGCRNYEDLNEFMLLYNCTCSDGSQRAVRGSCTLSACRAAYAAYQVIYTIMVAVSAAALLMQGMVFLRATSREEKPLTVGASLAFAALVSRGPGHALYVLISQLTCVFPGANGQACVFHDSSLWWLAFTSALLTLVSAAVSLAASSAAKQRVSFIKNHVDDSNNNNQDHVQNQKSNL